MIGVDVISLDYGPSIHYPAHTILLGANIPGIENVANLDQLAAELRQDDEDALRSRTTKNLDVSTGLSVCQFSCIAQTFVHSTLLALLARSTALTRLLACSLIRFLARGESG